MNMSHSNEDTGYNCLVKGCTSKVWYVPKPVYTWRFKPNSITRFNNGMYGSESGMCGYLTNMIWQIKELEKRFVNKNYIMQETVSIMCTLYHFYVENMQRYPLGSEANLEWCRYYYEQCYKPYEDLIDETTLTQIFVQVAAGQNLAQKGIIPKMTFFQFMDLIKEKPYEHNPMHDVGGAVIEIPQTTPENYPVTVHEYMNNIMSFPAMNTNTNLARMDGMQRILDRDKEQRKEFLENVILSTDVTNSLDVEEIINNTINPDIVDGDVIDTGTLTDEHCAIIKQAYDYIDEQGAASIYASMKAANDTRKAMSTADLVKSYGEDIKRVKEKNTSQDPVKESVSIDTDSDKLPSYMPPKFKQK